MRVVVVGATGPVGIHVMRTLLAAGHDVIIYARSPGKIPQDIIANERVAVIHGDLEDVAALTSAIVGADAVISALGPAVRHGPFHSAGNPLAHGYERIVQVMSSNGIRRLIALGTASIKDKVCAQKSMRLSSRRNRLRSMTGSLLPFLLWLRQ